MKKAYFKFENSYRYFITPQLPGWLIVNTAAPVEKVQKIGIIRDFSEGALNLIKSITMPTDKAGRL